ncbi:hypothetical protein HanRHA438_Chr08g0342771 [Helianthus annuus]|nr:hypothetical protein HanRHA438_Chr08g0342771 [Helianthus annuus]
MVNVKLCLAESNAKRARFEYVKPRVIGMSVVCVQRFKPSQGFWNGGNTWCILGIVPKRRSVLKTKISTVRISHGDFMMNLESVDGPRCISRSGEVCKPVETEDGSGLIVGLWWGGGGQQTFKLTDKGPLQLQDWVEVLACSWELGGFEDLF